MAQEHGAAPEMQFTPDIIRVEPRDDAADRLQQLPLIVDTPTDSSEALDVYVTGRANSDNGYAWLGVTPAKGMLGEPISPQSPAFTQVAPSVEEYVRGSGARRFFTDYATYKDGRWWQGNPGVELAVENSLKEVYRIDAGSTYKPVDILNCSSQPLSDEERAAVDFAINSIVAFTDGKIMDRVTGIVLGGSGMLHDKDAGGFSPFDGIVRLDLDHLREYNDLLMMRYNRYFPGKRDEVNAISTHLAHELTHAMDTTNPDEVEAHNLRPDLKRLHWLGIAGVVHDVSAFQNQFGWQGEKLDDKNHWRHDETRAIEDREHPLTQYASTKPAEDFAETGAIAALGGDVSSAPMRVRMMQDTLNKARGRTSANAHAELEKLDIAEYPPHRISALRLHVALI